MQRKSWWLLQKNHRSLRRLKGEIKMKIVIYREFGMLKTTTEENYNARIKNANKIQVWKDFETAEEIIDYCIKYCVKKAENFIVR